jgi:hypothetical protein
MTRRPPPQVKASKAPAGKRLPSGSAGAKRKQRPAPTKSLVAGRSGPHARFPKASSSHDKPLARKAQQPKTSSRQSVARVHKPVVSVFGRRLTPHPKPRT